MKTHFIPHMEILPPSQRQLWTQLSTAYQKGFVLYGGTAIALRLGHRPSIDFDFFSERELSKAILFDSFPFLSQVMVIQDDLNTLSVLAPSTNSEGEAVKISFFGGLRCGRVGDPQFTEDNVLYVASLEDLMAHKLKVVLQRVEAKDYLDIAAMIKAGVKLETGLADAKALFGNTFQPSESLKAIVYFEGGDLFSLSQDIKNILIHASTHVKKLPKVKPIKNLID